MKGQNKPTVPIAPQETQVQPVSQNISGNQTATPAPQIISNPTTQPVATKVTTVPIVEPVEQKPPVPEPVIPVIQPVIEQKAPEPLPLPVVIPEETKPENAKDNDFDFTTGEFNLLDGVTIKSSDATSGAVVIIKNEINGDHDSLYSVGHMTIKPEEDTLADRF